jgi:endoglucanase
MLWKKKSFLLLLALNTVFGSHLRNDMKLDNIVKEEESDQKIIKGINWFGFETEYKNLMCSWSHGIEWHLKKIKSVGFNYIRLPFSLEYVLEGNWKYMDEFFEKSRDLELDVVLDFHRLHSTHQSAKPYDNTYDFDDFLNGWKTILDRYKDYENLCAVDIFNEYQSTNYVEWNNLARQIVSFIETNFPERFEFFVGGTNWGGNIHNMDLSDLVYHNRIRYSIHKYWFSDTEPYEGKWNYSFGDHKPVVNVGEWGYMSDIPSEVEWAERFVEYLRENDLKDTFFWTWSHNSGDTAGILLETSKSRTGQDCTDVDYKKMLLLHQLWSQ